MAIIWRYRAVRSAAFRKAAGTARHSGTAVLPALSPLLLRPGSSPGFCYHPGPSMTTCNVRCAGSPSPIT